MPIPYLMVAIGGFVSMTVSRVVAVVASKKLTNTTPNPSANSPPKSNLAKRDIGISKAESLYLKGKAEREQELLNIQADLANMREIEVRANLEIAKAEAEREDRALIISERTLKLKQQELELAKARLKQEKQISLAQQQQIEWGLKLKERELELMAEELAEQQKLGYLHLEQRREQTAQKVNLKLREIQANWDRENWSGILSREEMKQILMNGQNKHRLLILLSPPDIEDCDQFNSHLPKQVRSEVKEFLEKNYPLNDDICPVEFYGKFFKSSVFDTEVKQLAIDLAAVPTVVIYSDITDENVYFHITCWGLEDSLSLTLPWNWEEEKQRLKLEGMNEDEIIKAIRQSIVKIHQLISAFLADLYYLNINPLHQPRLFQIETDLPSDWVSDHFGVLQDIQQQKLAEYYKNIEQPKFEPIPRFIY
ncbi:hypothetical protein [Planktothrix mougeotii]|uniref:Uncharacterized protein n=1 Tax=Planktothrix mougeotii LEGE 06226 TaxID=1828728 RepID=A0ABR9UH52_9CYAN|nr:hypothetical protein [Planktothrix mougeotii]MBE9145797.1 hypothetical protein [Planktothrix mougeotii LEGE 06226]